MPCSRTSPCWEGKNPRTQKTFELKKEREGGYGHPFAEESWGTEVSAYKTVAVASQGCPPSMYSHLRMTQYVAVAAAFGSSTKNSALLSAVVRRAAIVVADESVQSTRVALTCLAI